MLFRSEQVLTLAKAIVDLPRMTLRGLMCIPEPAADAAAAQRLFERATELLRQCQRAGIVLDTLSMGMSNDLEPAIAAGSTMVRVGSAIFGNRPPARPA